MTIRPDLVAAYETELDQLLPASRPKGGWRKNEPFIAEPLPVLRRVKWLLKRRELLLSGRDWEVELVTPDARNPRKVFAVPQEPPEALETDDPRNPRSPIATRWVPPNAAALALELHISLDRVEAALATLPESHRTDAGVRAWIVSAPTPTPEA